MKNKGFTLVEMLAVIVLIGIVSTIATISYTKYRKEVEIRELNILRNTISDSYDNYRSHALMSSESPETKIEFEENYDNNKYTFFNELTFDGDRLKLSDLKDSVFELKVKGDLLNINAYKSGANEAKMIKDGTCLVEATPSENVNSEGYHEFTKECATEESSGAIKPSLEEMLCVKLVINGETKINDFKDNKSLCKYFGEPVDE